MFDDFAPEIERIIDEMIESGEFGEILADVVNGLIASEYSTTQGYAQFDYVLKDGKLYCATASTSGEWDSTKWRETTVGADMQLLNQRVYNLNAGQVAFNGSAEYDNNTVGKKLQELDEFDDNLNAGQVAFNGSAEYDNNTVGKKLQELDEFDDNLNAGQVAYNSESTYNNATVGKELQELKDALNKEILYFTGQAVSAATSAQIMRIPASGTNSSITTDTVVLECVFANPAVITSDVSWTSYAGYIAFTGTATESTTANVVLGTKNN